MIKRTALTLVTFAMLLLMPLLKVNAIEYVNGHIKDPVITMGRFISEGDVEITKTVTQKNDSNIFNVEFFVRGKNIIKHTNKNVYAVFVFDRSGSMLCDGETQKANNQDKEYSFNGEYLKCKGSEKPNKEKWESAVEDTIDLSEEILSAVPDAKLGMVIFDSSSKVSREFSSNKFLESNFDYPFGDTNIASGINKAIEKLDAITDSNAVKFIILVSDGKVKNKQNAEKAANDAKEKNIIVYSLGYGTDEGTKGFLKDLSSNETCYSKENYLNIKTELAGNATESENLSAGVSAKITDKVGKNFSYINNENEEEFGKTLEFEFDEITEEGTKFSFDIKLNTLDNDEWNETNEILDGGVKLTYVSSEDEETATIYFEKSSEVYWELPSFKYYVKYYKNSISQENFLGVKEYSALKTVKVGSIDPDLYKKKGFKLKETTELPFELSSDFSKNVINVIYTEDIKYNEIVPPKTGVEELNILSIFSSLLSPLLLVVLRKKI